MLDFNKRILLTLAVFLILVIGLGLVVYDRQKSTAYKKILEEKEAILIVDYGQGQERWFKGEVIEGMTVRDALETAGSAGRFNFTANAKLIELQGLPGNQEKKWRCYLNNKEIEEELDKKIISPKDKILCAYR